METSEAATIEHTDLLDVQEFDNEAMVLLSGGVDSTACLAFLKSQNTRSSCLYINYGHSAANQETRAALEVSAFYGVRLKQIAVSGFPHWGAGFIPGRNAFLLHTALMATTFKKGMIAIGIHSGTAYSDCSDYFLRQMQSSFDVYTEGRISVCAPFLHWTKKEIWEYCRMMKVPFELTYSCEAGHDPVCGQCLSCIDRGLLI
jgi:7-cyano-7-deazaguanine synthase